ncbi:nuclear transport factor 2 family protein [Lactobacillus hamsteri]|uniref:DUF4440 domain-containing protein n=1 Tax=Lactobacillus hamsteri DSM 5661 = JCM 6256 TaxID=1423754 RepID=A0A0R1YNC7_9LACO|nr:nuclear transport factor 2 family protein [Lactobacillus hamsteri]KRM40700.1 hypothetical protein FC39_GL000184 [Lactobacillus hamsteri DSM 5661 = JCM 6256]
MTELTERKKLIDLYHMETQAVVDKDISTLNKILAPSMELKLTTGYVMSKIKWIDQIQNEEMKYYSSIEENIKDIKINDNRASLVGQNQVKGNFWNNGIKTMPLQAKVHFVKDNDNWIITKQEISTY